MIQLPNVLMMVLQGSWTKVYEAWKELTSMLIRGYNNHGFEAWTIPALYMVGKYLRLFAIKSDAERGQLADNGIDGSAIMQDDFDPESQKQSQLRDCEQQLKRIFTLCLNDRYVKYWFNKTAPINHLLQGTSRRVSKMGYILHCQLIIQNLFQAEFCFYFTNDIEDPGCLQNERRYPTIGGFSKITASHLQVL